MTIIKIKRFTTLPFIDKVCLLVRIKINRNVFLITFNNLTENLTDISKFDLHLFYYKINISIAYGNGSRFPRAAEFSTIFCLLVHYSHYFHLGILQRQFFLLCLPDCGLGVRVFANGPGDLGSIPGRVIPKTQKMVLDASLLSTQHYKVRIKGKVEQSRKGVAPSPTHWCSSYRKGSLRVTLDYGRQLYLLT